MKRKISLALGLVAVGSVGFFVLHGCGGTTNSASTSNSYAGPGSHYTITMSGTTFSLNKYTATTSTTTDFTVSGTVSALSNGFKLLTATAVTGTGGPAVGDTAYAMEVPGMAVFLKPVASGSDQVLTAVASGTCPTTTFDANWIKVKTSQDLSNASSDFYGTFNYNTTSGVASLPAKYSLANSGTSLGSQTFTAATCSKGIMSFTTTGTDSAVLYLTSIGGAVVNTSSAGNAAEFILALPSATITGSSLAGSYAGILFSDSAPTGSKVKPVTATFTYSGTTLTGVGTALVGVTGTATTGNSATVTLNAINSPSKGMMTGTMTTNGVTTNLSCMGLVGANGTTKNIINCAARDPGDSTKLFNFLLVSTN